MNNRLPIRRVVILSVLLVGACSSGRAYKPDDGGSDDGAVASGSGGRAGGSGGGGTGKAGNGGNGGDGLAATGGSSPGTGGAEIGGAGIAGQGTDGTGGIGGASSGSGGAPVACPAATPKKCPSGDCIAATGCCTNSDCPTNAAGQAGTCDTAAHACSYACAGATKSCTTNGMTACIPMGGCCTTSDCPSACTRCDTTTRACVAIKGAVDPDGRCAGTCDANGACKSKQGQTCTTTTGGCIAGTSCVDGYCCNDACTGTCMACDVSGKQGTCSSIPANGTPHGARTACPGAGTMCGGRCDGTTPACTFPPTSTVCSAAACQSTTTARLAATCNGSGSCSTPATQVCSGGAVCSGAGVCGCPSGQTNCSGTCINTKASDAKNCGGCGTTCPSTAPLCVSGSCKQCTAGDNRCQPGYVCSNNACVCNTSNLLQNPNFDKAPQLGFWMTTTAIWDTPDVTNSLGSGSASLPVGGRIHQCLPMGSAGIMYTLQYSYRTTQPGTMGCYGTFHTDSNCNALASFEQLGVLIDQDGSDTWKSNTQSARAPTGTKAIKVSCFNDLDPTLFLDRMSLTTSCQ